MANINIYQLNHVQNIAMWYNAKRIELKKYAIFVEYLVKELNITQRKKNSSTREFQNII